MKPVTVCETKSKANKKGCWCCFRPRRKASAVELDTNINEPYEYIVEKLIIKRVPINRGSNRRSSDSEDAQNDFDKKSIVTFSSYFQLPVKSKKDAIQKSPLPKSITNLDECLNIGKTFPFPAEPNVIELDDREKIDIQLAKAKLQNTPSQVKAMTEPQQIIEANLEGVSKLTNIDPSVKQALNFMATRKPPINKRFVSRELAKQVNIETGQANDNSSNNKLSETLKLDDVFNKKSEEKSKVESLDNMLNDDHSDVVCGDHKSSKSNQSGGGLKWKIIIKHHKRNKELRDVPTTSECITDSEA